MENNDFEVRDMRIKEKFFIDDEYLNGYAKYCGINATGVYFVLCRHADRKQECFPSKKLIAEKIGIAERTVYTSIKKLEEWNIVKKEGQGRKRDGSFKNHIYILIDKKYWKNKPQATVADGKIRHSPQANDDTHRRQLLPNKDTQKKDTHKEGLQTEVCGINKIFDLFYNSINPNINYANKTQRGAIQWLIDKYGLDSTLAAAKYAISVQGQPYKPVITTPLQLKDKMAALIILKQSNKPKITIIS